MRCETTPPCVFTPGEAASPLKWSGTWMRISSFSTHALEVHVHDCVACAGWRLQVLDDRSLLSCRRLRGRGSTSRTSRCPPASCRFWWSSRMLTRLVVAAVEDCRDLARATQAAARTLALRRRGTRRRVRMRLACSITPVRLIRDTRPVPPPATRSVFAIGQPIETGFTSIHVQRAHRFLVADAADRLGQQLRDRQLPDLRHMPSPPSRQRDGVGHHQLVERRLRDLLDRRCRTAPDA